MSLRHYGALFVLVVLLGLCGAQQSGPPVRFFGSTMFLRDRDQNDQPLSNPHYIPAPGVKVFVARSNSQLADTQSDSTGDYGKDGMGRPTLTIAAGLPVKLVFDGPEQYVPELLQLSAEQGREHVIHVTLLNERQYEEIYGKKTLVQRYQMILELLRNVDSADAKAIRERILRRLPQLR